MAFTHSSVSLPSNTITVLIANDDAIQLEFNPISQAIVQAQEQFHLVMEAKQTEDLWWWMEKGWENQMAEQDSVVVSDKELAVEGCREGSDGDRDEVSDSKFLSDFFSIIQNLT